jgi:hypothetical protein
MDYEIVDTRTNEATASIYETEEMAYRAIAYFVRRGYGSWDDYEVHPEGYAERLEAAQHRPDDDDDVSGR